MNSNQMIIYKALSKAITDNKFKNELLSDYKSALSRISSHELHYPDINNIRFVDSNSNFFSDDIIKIQKGILIISIPCSRDISDIELSDSEMEVVSGGLIIAPLKWLVDKITGK